MARGISGIENVPEVGYSKTLGEFLSRLGCFSEDTIWPKRRNKDIYAFMQHLKGMSIDISTILTK